MAVFERMINLDIKLSEDYDEGFYYCFYADYEISDAELQMLALHSSSYDFWNDPCEDIYTLENGEPV
jgi:hypothetical protein